MGDAHREERENPGKTLCPAVAKRRSVVYNENTVSTEERKERRTAQPMRDSRKRRFNRRFLALRGNGSIY